ncbi:MAG TPA: HupE/UreJ family protein [Candidatus Limnocylindrales bacterium]|nr:HupE/UreJ family protein [Candidatus Limnocylindrales bacterium]
MHRIVALATLAVALLFAERAHAHALDPVLLELRERGGGIVDVTWKASRAQIPGVELAPVLPEHCRRAGETTVVDEDDSSTSTWRIDCGNAGLAGSIVGVSGLESTDALLRVELASGATDRRVLGTSRPTVQIEAAPSRLQVVRDYAVLGVEHILAGLDHLLFVLGLLLLVPRASLLATITAFTAGHSVTLALAALQIVQVPQAPVEVVIALSIYVLAVELARGDGRQTLLRRRPWAMALAFGLLHGLGFAGALAETGLPQTEIPLALFAFNVGIELGQIVFVAAMLVASAMLRGLLTRLPSWVRLAPVYVMGALAAFWMMERTSLLL